MCSISSRLYFTVCVLAVLQLKVLALAPPYYGNDRPTLEYELPPLEYKFEDLEPYIDRETVKVHYLGHHHKYAELMNNALRSWRIKDKLATRISLVDILRNLTQVPEEFRKSLHNYGGGYFNHNLYWAVMSPNKDGEPRLASGQVALDIQAKWNSFHDFRKAFTAAGNSVFGSGYVWLCRNYTFDPKSSDLYIIPGQNQDVTIDRGLFPILTLDVWEHAYYVKHRNQRNNYITDWWKVVDWNQVTALDNWWRGVGTHDEL